MLAPNASDDSGGTGPAPVIGLFSCSILIPSLLLFVSDDDMLAASTLVSADTAHTDTDCAR